MTNIKNERENIIIDPIDIKRIMRKYSLAGVAQWLSAGLRIKGSPVQFPVRAHAWVEGQVPSGGM